MATFPSFTGLTLPIKRTVIWNTLIQESIGGVQTAQTPYTYPKYKWELPFSFFRQSTAYQEIQQIMAFVNSQSGRATAFLYNDPNDSTSGTDQTVGTGDSTTTAFQLVRARGGYVEPVFGFSTVSTSYVTSIKVGSTTLSTAAYTVSNKGILTLSSAAPSAQSVQWNGSFAFYCRLDEDQYEFEQFTASSNTGGGPLWSISKISFTSIKFGA